MRLMTWNDFHLPFVKHERRLYGLGCLATWSLVVSGNILGIVREVFGRRFDLGVGGYISLSVFLGERR